MPLRVKNAAQAKRLGVSHKAIREAKLTPATARARQPKGRATQQAARMLLYQHLEQRWPGTFEPQPEWGIDFGDAATCLALVVGGYMHLVGQGSDAHERWVIMPLAPGDILDEKALPKTLKRIGEKRKELHG